MESLENQFDEIQSVLEPYLLEERKHIKSRKLPSYIITSILENTFFLQYVTSHRVYVGLDIDL